jgi:hypothetical protein
MRLTEEQYAKAWMALRAEELRPKIDEEDPPVMTTAIQATIYDFMKVGRWYTSGEIAARIKRPPDMVEKSLLSMKRNNVVIMERVSDFYTFKLNARA